MVYAVFRQAIYRHACAGIFSTLDGAISCADTMANDDGDDHHSYEVVPFELDKLPQIPDSERRKGSSPEILESLPVYTVCKSGVLPCRD